MQEILSKCCILDIEESDHSTDIWTQNSIWGPGPKMRGQIGREELWQGQMVSPPLSEMPIDYISQLPLPLAGDIRLSPLMIAQSKGSQTPPVTTMYCVV